MPSPVTPNDFRNLVPEAGAKICRVLLNLGKAIQLMYRLVAWMLKPNGEVSDEFKASVGIPSGSGLVTTPIGTPTGVQASDGDFNDKVRITWTPVGNATSYEVFRALSNDFTLATSIGAPTEATYDDPSAVVNTNYFYWVRARGPDNAVGGISLSDPGHSNAGGTGAAGTVKINSYASSGTFVVPEGVFAIWIELWGAGGGGGSGRAVFGIGVSGTNPVYGGGGGGSGEFVDIGGVTVAPGDILEFSVGSIGGAHGTEETRNGSVGADTAVFRKGSTTPIAKAKGGNGGMLGLQSQPSSGGSGGSGGEVNEGTLLRRVAGVSGDPGGSATPPNVGAGGAGGAAPTIDPAAKRPKDNHGGAGAPSNSSGGQDGASGYISFFK